MATQSPSLSQTSSLSSTVKVKLGDDIRRIIVEDFASLRNAVVAQYYIDWSTHRPSFHYIDGIHIWLRTLKLCDNLWFATCNR